MVIRGRGAYQPAIPAEMRRLERLKGVLPTRVFENVEHFSGLTDPQLRTLLGVQGPRLADAIAQLNRGEDEQAIAAAVARFNEATGEHEDEDRTTIGDLLAGANRGELLVRIPVYTGLEVLLTSNVALFDSQPLPAPKFHIVIADEKMSENAGMVLTHLNAGALFTKSSWRCSTDFAEGGTSERDLRDERSGSLHTGYRRGTGHRWKYGAEIPEVAGGHAAETPAFQGIEAGRLHRVR